MESNNPLVTRAVVTAARFSLYFEMYYLLGFTTSVNSPLSKLYSG